VLPPLLVPLPPLLLVLPLDPPLLLPEPLPDPPLLLLLPPGDPELPQAPAATGRRVRVERRSQGWRRLGRMAWPFSYHFSDSASLKWRIGSPRISVLR
jgi:hypothetical protein